MTDTMETNKPQGLVIVLSGFSGAVKGTIMKHLLATYPDQYCLSVSATTRGRRPGEEDGREYFFKTREEFEAMIAAGELVHIRTDPHAHHVAIAHVVGFGATRRHLHERGTEGLQHLLVHEEVARGEKHAL